MKEETKIIFALQQIDNLTLLTENNEQSEFIHFHLIQIQIELERQLTNLKYHSKIKE